MLTREGIYVDGQWQAASGQEAFTVINPHNEEPLGKATIGDERDGHWLVGQGMADCAMGCFRSPSTARVRLLADGSAVAEAGTQDIGTGTLTIFPQIAADVLGLEPGLVSLRMGDTSLPEAGMTDGSSSTMGVGSAVMASRFCWAPGSGPASGGRWSSPVPAPVAVR